MYSSWPNSADMESIFQVTTNDKTKKIVKVANYAANIFIPALVCILTHCNLLIVGASFILTDIILNLIEYYIAVVKPHEKIRSGLLSEAKDKFNATIGQKEMLSTKIEMFKTSKNKKSEDVGTYDDYCNWTDNVEDLETFIKYETDWMEQKLIPYKEEEIKSVQKPAKDYTDKRQFFVAFDEKLGYYINSYKLTCLNTVQNAIKSLVSTLDERQDGYEMVPSMFYVYIDELQKILEKIKNLKAPQMKEHIDDLTKVSNALSDNINRMVFKINNTEAEEIDIGLSVLLKELEDGVV